MSAPDSTITCEGESVARAIAKALGQDFDTLPTMTFDPGSFCQDDFIRAAKAAGPAYGSKRRPYYSGACLGVDGMGANLRLSDGTLELVFKDEELDLINEEGRDLYVARLAASEVIALRQWLIDYLPVAETEIGAGHGVTPPVSVTVPALGTEERDFWLEAAEQHGFERTSGEEELPAFDPPAYLATEDEVLKLMAVAREQGRKDVLDALATGGEE